MTLPLCELYRPTEFAEVIGVRAKEKIETLIAEPNDMPNILLYGPQGTGKTTCAKIMIEKLKPIDVLRINGSDTTGVDTVREKVFNFITAMSSVPNKPRLVWIEEFDFMSANAFAALRSMIEQYMKNARFICTANYINKIPEPIQSRFSLVEFDKISMSDIIIRLKQIVAKDEIEVKEGFLTALALHARGDMRQAINLLQTNKDEGYFKAENSLVTEVHDLLMEGNWSKLRYEIPNKYPDYNNLLVDLDDMFFESDIPMSKKADINDVISTGLAEMSLSFNADICFSAVCSRIIRAIKK